MCTDGQTDCSGIYAEKLASKPPVIALCYNSYIIYMDGTFESVDAVKNNKDKRNRSLRLFDDPDELENLS